jgi:hypothetical protein
MIGVKVRIGVLVRVKVKVRVRVNHRSRFLGKGLASETDDSRHANNP